MRPSTARRRARAAAAAQAEGVQHLVFRVGGDEYALPLLDVREIVHLGALSPVPEAPSALRGVMSLRLEPVAVVDLAIAFGGRRGPDTLESCALIAPAWLDGEQTLVGLAVDAVSRVIGIAQDEMAPAPRLGRLVDVQLVGAMARAEQGLVPILDLERLLASEEVRAAVSASRIPAGTWGAQGAAD